MASKKNTALRLVESAVVQPSVRVTTNWSPALLRQLLQQADHGNMRLLAELCDELIADDRIGATLDTRIGGLLGLDLSFEAAGDGNPDKRVVKALEAEDDWWAAFPEPVLKQVLIWGRMAGVAFAQIHPVERNQRMVPKIEFWHLKNTRYDWQSRQWYAKVDNGAREVVITPGDGQWIMYAPNGEHRPWAHGLWRGLSRWWLLKSYAKDDAGRRSEKSGITVATTTMQAQHAERKALASELAGLSQAGVVALPEGFDLKILETSEKVADNQGTIVDMANMAISIAVLGQNLTTEVSGGSFAAAKVHNKVEIQRIREDGETASTTLHDQALTWWAEWNFGNADLAPYPVWATDPPTDQKERAEVLNKLSDVMVKLDKLGLEIDPKEIEEEFGVKLKKKAGGPTQTPPQPLGAQQPAGEVEEEPETQEQEPDGQRSVVTRETPDSEPREAKHPGQDYADRVAEALQAEGAEALGRAAAAMITVVRNASGYGEAYQRIITRYRDMAPPSKLAAITEMALIMAQLGGHLEVHEKPGG